MVFLGGLGGGGKVGVAGGEGGLLLSLMRESGMDFLGKQCVGVFFVVLLGTEGMSQEGFSFVLVGGRAWEARIFCRT